MEKTMNNNQLLTEVLLKAKTSGNELEPSDLLNVVNRHSDPIHALSNIDQSNEFFASIQAQFGFIQSTKISYNKPNTEEFEKWAALIRWLMRELIHWHKDNDPKFHKLTALFVTANYCDINDQLWTLLPPALDKQSNLLDTLEEIIAKANYSLSINSHTPIWEKEIFEQFMKAEADGDWVTISELWISLEAAVMVPNILITQTIRCFYHFGFTRLIKTLEVTHQTFMAMHIADSINIEQRLKLSSESNNPYIQFACVYHTFLNRRQPNVVTKTEKKLLVKTLSKVADDAPRWTMWMHIYNRYPLRYPSIQEALGLTLACAPESAIQSYIEAINLSTRYNASRKAVAICLSTFKSVASNKRRLDLWRLAYDHWSKWNTDISNDDMYLSGIGYSELDYAIVAYSIECMNNIERDAELANLQHKLEVLNSTWYASLTDCASSWNRLLSQFQPYAHAQKVIGMPEDWLLEDKYYAPDIVNEHYITMMYQMY